MPQLLFVSWPEQIAVTAAPLSGYALERAAGEANAPNSNLATLIRTVVILAISVLIVAWRHEWEPLENLSRKGALFLVLSGIATGLSWLCYYRALQMAPASKVAPIDKLSVAMVIVLAVLFLGEPLSWRVVLGGALVVAGVLILAK